MEKVYKAGIELLEEQIIQKNNIREKSKIACGDLLNAHCLSCGVIKKQYEQYLGVIGKTNSSISTRLPLIASFVQGIDLCEISINEGLYTQAAVLIKQELETVAAINECTNNQRKDRVTPNIKFVNFGINSEYGFLNGIGHVSDTQLFEVLFKAESNQENQQPISITPLFNEELCVRFYVIHILLILQIVDQLCNLIFEMYDTEISDDLQKAVQIVYTVLHKEKWLIE